MRIADQPTSAACNRVAAIFACLLLATPTAMAEDDGWITLFGDGGGFEAFREPIGAWHIVGSATLDPDDPKHLASTEGSGVAINDPPGRTRNLESIQEFGDVEVAIEYMLPEDSNAGVKFLGLYEIQMYDSFDKPIDARGNGGVYPRAELLPRYHHIDEGFPPMVNASKPPGEWQTLTATFRAPSVRRIGQEGRERQASRRGTQRPGDPAGPRNPLSHRPRLADQGRRSPVGPLLLQADHGPVAFRSVRVRPIGGDDAP